MRAYRLRGGGIGIAFRVEHLLTEQDMVDALGESVVSVEGPLPDIGAAEIGRRIRGILHGSGALGNDSADWPVSARRAEEITEWAAALVRRHYGAAFDSARVDTPPAGA